MRAEKSTKKSPKNVVFHRSDLPTPTGSPTEDRHQRREGVVTRYGSPGGGGRFSVLTAMGKRCGNVLLGCDFKYLLFLLLPGEIIHLTSIFFKGVENTT